MNKNPTYLSTGKHLTLDLEPIEGVDSFVVAGGACRDTLIGGRPVDYDIFVATENGREKYDLIGKCMAKRFNIVKPGSIKGSFSNSVQFFNLGEISKFFLDLSSVRVDLIEVRGVDEITYVNSFDYIPCCCYARIDGDSMRGEIMVREDAQPLLSDKILEINPLRDRTKSTKRLVERARKFSEREWYVSDNAMLELFRMAEGRIKYKRPVGEIADMLVDLMSGKDLDEFGSEYDLLIDKMEDEKEKRLSGRDGTGPRARSSKPTPFDRYSLIDL